MTIFTPARPSPFERDGEGSNQPDHALSGNDCGPPARGRLDRSAVNRSAPVIFWRNFSSSDRTSAKLRATLPIATKSGRSVIPSRPDAATVAVAKVVARPNLRSVFVDNCIDDPPSPIWDQFVIKLLR
jgi:hypothetical protein